MFSNKKCTNIGYIIKQENTMLISTKKILTTAVFSGLLIASSVASADKSRTYMVTITNLTNSINFTPILVASHNKKVSIFETGTAASPELTAIAEGGNTVPLATALNNNDYVNEVHTTAGLLGPGMSVSVEIKTQGDEKRISVASMMLPTNDGFIGLSNIKAPKKGSKTYYSPGYDAGTELNDELCSSIPGPTCRGAGPSPEEGGEGYIHINRGIHGIADLDASVYDWRNPVAKITITRKNN